MITEKIFKSLEEAYRFFNRELFGGKLSECVILLHRKKGAYGYFAPERWASGDAMFAEIALNPVFLDRPLRETLSTLVHEMAHHQQFESGEPGKGNNHNREFSDMMERVGLITSSTGAPGGKRTGSKMSHYIEEGGAFDRACARLLDRGFSLDDFVGLPGKPSGSGKDKKRYEYDHYVCPGCKAKVRGKPGLELSCRTCSAEMEVNPS